MDSEKKIDLEVKVSVEEMKKIGEFCVKLRKRRRKGVKRISLHGYL